MTIKYLCDIRTLMLEIIIHCDMKKKYLYCISMLDFKVKLND